VSRKLSSWATSASWKDSSGGLAVASALRVRERPALGIDPKLRDLRVSLAVSDTRSW
jgi:hypothetical protein